MAVDKLVDSTQLDTDLTSVANAIRTKGGTSAQLAFPAGFVQAIADIPSGGGGEITLLASGSYTQAADAQTMTIPFSTSGTPILAYVKAASVVSGVWQIDCWLTGNVNLLSADAKADFAFLVEERYRNTSGVLQTSTAIPVDSTSGDGLNADHILCRRHNGSIPIRANTYNWYVWGVSA